MATLRLHLMLLLAFFGVFIVAATKSKGKVQSLEVHLKQHVRALDAGRDVSRLSLPVSVHQVVGGASTCEDKSTCLPATVTCGAFNPSFCEKLQCLPSRKVTRGRITSEITCKRAPYERQPTSGVTARADRYCCTREFCIRKTCKPTTLSPASLAGRSIGDVVVTEEAAIPIPRSLKTDIYMLLDKAGGMSNDIRALGR